MQHPENFVLHDVEVYVVNDPDGAYVELSGKNRDGSKCSILLCEGDRADLEKVQMLVQDELDSLREDEY